jgi:hypothetical protein
MLSDAPTNPRNAAPPSAAQAVIPPEAKHDADPPEAKPDADPHPKPGRAPELRVAAAADGQNAQAPRAEDDAMEPQDSSGAHVETVTVVRVRMDALRARYLRLMVAVAVAAAACAALVTALLMRRATPVVPHSRAVRLEDEAPRAPARATTRAPARPVETPTQPVEALPTESPSEASLNEPPADDDTAPSRTVSPNGADRSASSTRSSVDASTTAQPGDTQRVGSKPARGTSGFDDGEANPRAAAAAQPEPAGKADPVPTSGAAAPAAASGKDWKASDPGF